MLSQEDIFLALLSYRATTIPELGASPAELMYGRRLRTTLPTSPRTLMPSHTDHEELRERDRAWKEKQRKYFNDTGVRELPDPEPGDRVLLKRNGRWRQPATVVEKCAPRSFLVETEGRQLRRNKTGILNAEAIPESVYDAASHQPSFNRQPSHQPSIVRPSIEPEPIPEVPMPPSPVRADPPSPAPASSPASQPVTRTRSGRAVVRPARYQE